MVGGAILALVTFTAVGALVVWLASSRQTYDESGGPLTAGDDAPLLPIIFGLTRDPATRTEAVPTRRRIDRASCRPSSPKTSPPWAAPRDSSLPPS
jgi:hypothetical protein